MPSNAAILKDARKSLAIRDSRLDTAEKELMDATSQRNRGAARVELAKLKVEALVADRETYAKMLRVFGETDEEKNTPTREAKVVPDDYAETRGGRPRKDADNVEGQEALDTETDVAAFSEPTESDDPDITAAVAEARNESLLGENVFSGSEKANEEDVPRARGGRFASRRA
jgi:hypothetical protein